MRKICLIRQPAGIGDIFFTQKIATEYLNSGYEIIWPVISEFNYIGDYIKTPGLSFVKETDDFPLKDLYHSNESKPITTSTGHVYLPIQHFDRHIDGSVMHAKYKLLNIDYSDWVEYFNFERNFQREEKLIEHFNIKNQEFYFVNRLFGSPPGSKKCPHMGNFSNSIEMTYLGWDNIFDWIGLLVNAKHIYTVETSILYIIKKLQLKNVTVFSRHTPPSFTQVEHIFDKEINFII